MCWRLWQLMQLLRIKEILKCPIEAGYFIGSYTGNYECITINLFDSNNYRRKPININRYKKNLLFSCCLIDSCADGRLFCCDSIVMNSDFLFRVIERVPCHKILNLLSFEFSIPGMLVMVAVTPALRVFAFSSGHITHHRFDWLDLKAHRLLFCWIRFLCHIVSWIK